MTQQIHATVFRCDRCDHEVTVETADPTATEVTCECSHRMEPQG